MIVYLFFILNKHINFTDFFNDIIDSLIFLKLYYNKRGRCKNNIKLGAKVFNLINWTESATTPMILLKIYRWVWDDTGGRDEGGLFGERCL